MLEDYIRQRLKTKKLLLMTHLVIGYPSLDDNLKMLEAMSECGSDIVELQFPFSEPMADGPLFVKANQEALESGITVKDCFDFMSRASKLFPMPMLMMGYYNTVFKMGEKTFCSRLKDSGAKGFIVPDLPPELGLSLYKEAKNHGLEPIQLIAPNTQKERIEEISSLSSGFIYCVARKGVTGKKTSFGEDVAKLLDGVREVSPLPLALGFGISKKENMDFISGKADIAIVGSALLDVYLSQGDRGVREFLKNLQGMS